MIPEVRTIKTAMNGQEALDVIASNKDVVFDVIFLDIHMPIMDGPTTVLKLRDLEKKGLLNLSNTKIVALSAITED